MINTGIDWLEQRLTRLAEWRPKSVSVSIPVSYNSHGLARSGLLLALVLALVGCAATPPRQHPLPTALAGEVTIPGIPDARYWGDLRPSGLDAWLTLSDRTLRARYGGIMDQPHTYLVISGGGGDGAFGAGLLSGWTQTGTRPAFQIVTGISTGALMAPLVFLGPDYDPILREVYTQFGTSDPGAV